MPRESQSVLDEILGRENGGQRLAVLGSPSLTYADLLHQAESLAKTLQTIGAGDRSLVGICVSMSSEYLVSLLGLYIVSAVPVLLNPRATAHENSYVCRDSGLNFLITDQEKANLPDSVNAGRQLQWGKLRLIGPVSEPPQDLACNDCMIIYTSGSTGRPKGIVLTREGISSNIRAVSNYLALSCLDCTVVFTPPSFAYAISQALTHLWSGGAILPWAHGLRYPGALLSAIQNHRITGVAANPTSFRIIAAHGAPAGDLNSVRYVMTGGQPLDSQVALEISRFFPAARIVNMYGCTENSPRVAFYWLPPSPTIRDTPWPVGHAVTGTQIKVVDESGGTVGPCLESAGEILVQGTSCMRGYWRDPDLTRAKIVDGWLHTGDLGFIDSEGALHLTGRLDNLFSVGHVKVSPEEIESILETVPGVREAGVVPLSDDFLGNVPVALAVLEGPEGDTLIRARRECDLKLSTAKRPRAIFSAVSLPRTHYGKLDRVKLRSVAESMTHRKSVSAHS